MVKAKGVNVAEVVNMTFEPVGKAKRLLDEAHEKVKQAIAEQYPEFIGEDTEGNKCFDMATLMRSKGHIK